MYQDARRRARKQGIPFNIEPSDITVPASCPALGFPLKVNRGGAQFNSPSLDRIIPAQGYTKGNVVVVSRLANQIKSNASIHQVEQVATFYRQLLKEIQNGYQPEKLFAGTT